MTKLQYKTLLLKANIKIKIIHAFYNDPRIIYKMKILKGKVFIFFYFWKLFSIKQVLHMEKLQY